MKSDVEKFYEAIRAKYGNSRSWNELHPQEQITIVQICNALLDILNRN